MRSRTRTGILVIAVALAACGKQNGGGDDDDDNAPDVELQLVRIGGTTTTAGAAPEGPAMLAGVLDTQFAWSSSVDVSSFKFSLGGITLRGAGNLDAPLFRCTTGECLVDVAASESNLLAGMTSDPLSPIRAGTYDRVDVSNCVSANPADMYVTAEVDIGGAAWFTDAQSGFGLSTAGPAEEVPIFLGNGCGLSYPLAEPLTLADGDAVTLRLYFDMNSLMRGASGTGPTLSAYELTSHAMCTSDVNPTAGFLCTHYANIAATIDEGTPAVEHYRINDGAVIGAFFNSEDAFFGGYSRKQYIYGEPYFGFPMGTLVAFSLNSDGATFSVQEFDGAFTMNDFQRVAVGQTFGGMWIDYLGSSQPYLAERLD